MESKLSVVPPKKFYFISDLHLGLHPLEKSREREKRVVRWLDEIKKDAQELFLVGDIFDFWFEYKRVAPQGFTRFLGKLAELADSGIRIHYFIGNHDIWFKNYLVNETGFILHKEAISVLINEKRFYIGHGDGLGPGDIRYKILRSIFHSRVIRWFFQRLVHPDAAVWIGYNWSKNSRYARGLKEEFQGEEKEKQIVYARQILKREHYDFFVLGHRHLPLDYKLSDTCRMINLGEWITQDSYAVFDGSVMTLKQFTK